MAEAHIRRHHEPPWPDHDPECDFYRDAAEQRAITRSYARLPDGKRVALLARLKTSERSRPQQLTGRSFARPRGALATLLVHLIEEGGLTRSSLLAVSRLSGSNTRLCAARLNAWSSMRVFAYRSFSAPTPLPCPICARELLGYHRRYSCDQNVSPRWAS